MRARQTAALYFGIFTSFFLGLTTREVHALGGQFGMEFAIDAPWRLEPVKAGDGSLVYGPIPVSITFLDAVFETARSPVSDYTSFDSIDVGRLREVHVVERIDGGVHSAQPATIIPAAQFREIERKALVSTRSAEPDHDICHPSAEQSCERVLGISRAHEWHGMFWYTPKTAVTPGRNIHLEVTVITEIPPLFTREWKNYLVVHAGDAPLPRFGDQWLYGDLHYHSQMTDNEGESGYSYRNVARALGASGMDFVFATDHASNGVQTDGKIEREFCADRTNSSCMEARDFNVHRYLVAKSLLYSNSGINNEILLDAQSNGLARLRAANVLPQVYLGEEIDVQAEISNSEFTSGHVNFGDGRQYPWPNVSNCLQRSSTTECRNKYSRAVEDGGYLLLDEQGIPIEEAIDEELGTGNLGDVVKFFTPDLTRAEPSRQHMVYFPISVSQNTDGWIGSDTGEFGGASKRLSRMLTEVEAGGFAFLAHPLENSRPGSPAGPDIVPFSERELDLAWRSPAILGMQFWNEDHRRISAPDVRNPTVMRTGARTDNARALTFYFQWPFQGHEYGNFPWNWQRMVPHAPMSDLLYHSAYTWDKYLRYGVDAAKLASLPWLEPGQPRRWYMAGGSDSHGDFNYRRTGTPGIERWTDVPITDTAIGLPRNLVSLEATPGSAGLDAGDNSRATGPRRYTNQEVIASLREGRFSVTDGPALRVAIDRNLNGKIDATDVAMGGVLDFFAGDRIPLLVEWISTREFGPVTRIDVYVGNDRITFAPDKHGVGVPGGIGQAGYGSYTPDPSAALQVSLADVYGRFNRGQDQAQMAYHGVATIHLGPAQFNMARADGALSYIRAFATTIPTHLAADLQICPRSESAGNKCGSRFAYTNPVWTRFRSTCPPKRRTNSAILSTTGINRSKIPIVAVDADGNRTPDSCEGTLVDACPPPAANSGPTATTNAGVNPRLRDNRFANATATFSTSHDTASSDMAQPDAARPDAARPIPQSSCQRVTVANQ